MADASESTGTQAIAGSRSDTVRLGHNVLAFGHAQSMRFLYGPASAPPVGGSGIVSGGLGGAVIVAGSADGSGSTQPSPSGAEPALLVPAGDPMPGGASFDPTAAAEHYVAGGGRDALVAGLGNDAVFIARPPDFPDVLGGAVNPGASFAELQAPASGSAGSATPSVPGASLFLHLPDGST